MTGPALRYPFNALVSFHYYRKHDLSQLSAGGLRIIADSGAYSARTLGAEIALDEFAEWALHWRAHLAWVASLDVINDPETTWKNYRILRHDLGVDVVPTLHAGDDKRWLDRYADDGVDFLGLGGLTPHRGRPQATIPWLADLMLYARAKYPTMRFHGWGATNPVLTKALPWYSVDSSNLGGAYRYGRLVLFDRSTGTWRQIKMDGRAAIDNDVLLARDYGVRGRDVRTSTPETRRLLVRVTGRSYQLVEDYLRKRHGPVTAPTYGVREPTPKTLGGPRMPGTRHGATGPHVHGTDGHPAHLQHLERTA